MSDIERPIEVTFDQSGVRVALVVSRLEVGEEKFETAIRIATHFKTEPTKDGPHLIRQAPVSVTTPDNPADAKKIQSFLTRKFNAFFQKDLYFDGMVPPVGGSGGKLRQLSLERFSTDRGWLIMGYELPPPETVAETLARP